MTSALEYRLVGPEQSLWAATVHEVMAAAGWVGAETANLILSVPDASSDDPIGFEEAEALQSALARESGTVLRDETGEPSAQRQWIGLFDGRLATLKHRFAGRSAVDAARADLVRSSALALAPGFRVNGLAFGHAPEGPDQRSESWQDERVREISEAIPALTALPRMVDYLHTHKAITGQIIHLNRR